jgi:hypothetical protein
MRGFESHSDHFFLLLCLLPGQSITKVKTVFLLGFSPRRKLSWLLLFFVSLFILVLSVFGLFGVFEYTVE